MKDLLKLSIIFENCDFIDIDKKDIHNFFIKDITESITLISNALLVYKIAGMCHLTLKWDNVKEKRTDGSFQLEARMLSHDITHYYIYLSDGSELKITTPWGESDYTNDKETHSLDVINGKEIFTIKHIK